MPTVSFKTPPHLFAFLGREHFNGIGCLLLDVQMPGLSGMDLQEKLSKADYHMPVTFITGHGDIPMSVEAMKKGAVDFLTKPFDDKQLLQVIENAIEKDRKAKAERAEVHDIRRTIELLTPRVNIVRLNPVQVIPEFKPQIRNNFQIPIPNDQDQTLITCS